MYRSYSSVPSFGMFGIGMPGIIIIVIIIAAIFVFFKLWGLRKAGKIVESLDGFDEIKTRYKMYLGMRGKTPEQKKIIKYFTAQGGCSGGCLGALFGNIRDADFDAILVEKVKSYPVYRMALERLGLVREQVQEIDPVLINNYCHTKNSFTKYGDDMVFRASTYQLSCLLFSDIQVYLYTLIFDLTSDELIEKTSEYFYKDITNIYVYKKTDTLNKSTGCGCLGGTEKVDFSYRVFRIMVPGGFDDNTSLACVMRETDEPAVMGAIAKMREKKM